MRRSIKWLLALALVPGVLSAQQPSTDIDNTRYGGTAAQFLTLPGDARGAALGGAYAALVSDVASMFWNPAGLALIQGREAMFSYTSYVADTRHIWAGMATPLRDGDWALGVSVTNFGFNDQPVYTEEMPDGTGETYDVSSTAIGVTLAFNFSDRFSAGITPKLVTENLAGLTGATFALDFGTNYHTELAGRPIRASFAVLNLGPSFSVSGPSLNVGIEPGEDSQNVDNQPARLRTTAFEPPIQFRVGVAYDLVAAADQRLTLLSDFWQPNDSDPGASFAAEFSRTFGPVTAALRGSYAYLADNAAADVGDFVFDSQAENDAALDGLAFGGGLNWQIAEGRQLSVDYAYRHLGVLSGVNMFSIRLTW